MSIVIDISKPQPPREDVEEFKMLAAKGIRSFALKKYSEAIELLAQSIELAVGKYGDKYDTLGEIYYHYGKALLELSREESDPLGDGVPKDVPVGPDDGSMDYDDESENDQSEDKEETEDENNEVGEAEGTDNDEPMEGDETEAAESDNMKNESTEEAAMESNEGTVHDDAKADNASHQGATSSGKRPTEEGEGENIEVIGTFISVLFLRFISQFADEKDEEPGDLQLAWEILELSKLIFESRGEPAKAHLADALIALGEVSMESENFDSAVEDIKRGLAIQKEIFKSDNRRIPETYYKLGVAYASINKKEEAIDCFNKSIEHLNQRIKILEPSKFPNDESEVKEMKGLVPEILEKIEDLKNEEVRLSDVDINNVIEMGKQDAYDIPVSEMKDLNI